MGAEKSKEFAKAGRTRIPHSNARGGVSQLASSPPLKRAGVERRRLSSQRRENNTEILKAQNITRETTEVPFQVHNKE